MREQLRIQSKRGPRMKGRLLGLKFVVKKYLLQEVDK
jgi:hypothetical protein